MSILKKLNQNQKRIKVIVFSLFFISFTTNVTSQKNKSKPNILVIFGDDVGVSNVSLYSRGLMGFTTPNIDKIGNEGAVFIQYYAQQSCTAGRAAFITGQSPYRTGLTKVGLPGSPVGLQKEDPTIAEFLKPLGYACVNLVKIILVIRTNIYLLPMDLMNSLEISIT